jgi:hypothetical protein
MPPVGATAVGGSGAATVIFWHFLLVLVAAPVLKELVSSVEDNVAGLFTVDSIVAG